MKVKFVLLEIFDSATNRIDYKPSTGTKNSLNQVDKKIVRITISLYGNSGFFFFNIDKSGLFALHK